MSDVDQPAVCFDIGFKTGVQSEEARRYWFEQAALTLALRAAELETRIDTFDRTTETQIAFYEYGRRFESLVAGEDLLLSLLVDDDDEMIREFDTKDLGEDFRKAGTSVVIPRKPK